MLEKQFQERSEIEILEIWMQSPPWSKPIVPFDAEKYLNWLQLAHKWLNEHGGDTRKVWPMVMSTAKARNEPLSESTARRYVSESMRLFVTFNPHSTRWTTEMLLNDTLHMALKAKTAGLHHEHVRHVTEARKLIDKLDQYIREDADRIMSPIAIEAVMDPSLIPGFTPDPDIRTKAELWLQRRIAAAGHTTSQYAEGDSDVSSV